MSCYLSRLFSPENLPNIGLFVAGVAGIIVALCTLKVLIRQTEATVRAANAAKDSADALISAERAWIVAELSPSTQIAYTLKITNMGRTPAQILGLERRYSCLPKGITDLPPDSGGDTAEYREFNHLLAAGEGVEILSFTTDEYMKDSWNEISKLEKTAVFHGFVRYRHMFSTTDDCTADFCYVYTPSLRRLTRVSKYTRYT